MKHLLIAWRWAGRRAWRGLSSNARGSVFLLAAGFFATVMVAGIKFAGQRIPVLEILFFRQLFLLIYLTPTLVPAFPATLRTRRTKLHLARCVISVCAMTTGFTAVVYLPLAEATVISFSRTFFTTVLAVIILREVVGIRRWGATIVGFIGVLIVMQPAPGDVNIYGLLAVISAALVACNLIMMKQLTRTDGPVTIMAWQAIPLTILFALPTWFLWVEPTWAEIALIAGIAGLMLVVQYCMIRGYKEAEASAAQPLEYVRLIYAAAIGFVLFAEIPTLWTWVGASVIIASAAYTLHRNAIRAGKK